MLMKLRYYDLLVVVTLFRLFLSLSFSLLLAFIQLSPESVRYFFGLQFLLTVEMFTQILQFVAHY